MPLDLLVSVVVINYNYGRFIGEAITSALNQTYKNIEVIVVDDGSTDNSRAVIESFGSRVRTLFKANGGQASAYNAGFLTSRGELVVFLDSDDFLEREAISEVAASWEPGVAKVHFYLRVVTGIESARTEVVIPNTQLADGDIRKQILETGSYAAPSASGNAYARFALEQIFPMPEEEWRLAADSYPIFLTPLLGAVRRCDRVLGCYRVHDSNHEFELPFDGKKLRYRLGYEVSRDEMLSAFCRARGVAYPAGRLEKQFSHLKARFASLSIEPAKHPFSGDRIWTLAAKLIHVTWAEGDVRFVKRLVLSVWVMALIIFPKRWRQRLVDAAFVPTNRPSVLNRSIRLAQSRAA